MSLVSFKVFREMARMHGSASASRGKKVGFFSDEEGRAQNVGDQSRIPLNIDQEDINFLNQFEQKDWSKALRRRQDLFVTTILPKLQAAVNKQIKSSGIERPIFQYLKTGNAEGLDRDVLQQIRKHYHVSDRIGLQVPVTPPSNVQGLIKGIRDIIEDLEVIKNDYILSGESKSQILNMLDRAKEQEASGGQQYKEALNKIYKDLKRDTILEDHTEALAHEIFRSSTVDSKEFWKKNALDPDAVEFNFSDKRSKSSNVQNKKPHFFRLYHKLERTRGEDHIEELRPFLGQKGEYGYDLKHPVKVGDEDESEVDTLGATFGSKATNAARWDRSVKKWFQHHSHGHFGEHPAYSEEDSIWMPVTVSGKQVEDPLYDWMFNKISKSIQKAWKDAEGDEGSEEPLDSDDEDYNVCYSSGGVFNASECAKVKARKVLVKAAREGKLLAPPVPCTELAQKTGASCPSKEERQYKVCDGCDGSGKSASGTKKKGNCKKCSGDGVVRPFVYVPHQKTKEGKWAPLMNPTSYMKQTDPEMNPEAHEDALQYAKEVMGDHFFDEIEYDAGNVKGSTGFPTWSQHSLRDQETLNMGQSDFETFGPTYNKAAKTQHIINPTSREGKNIINTILKREEVSKGSKKYYVVPDFLSGILVCLNGACGGAPGFVLETLKRYAGDVHEVIYSLALRDLGAFKNVIQSSDEGDSESKDRTLSNWAAGKTSSIAQRLSGYEEIAGGGTYTRRKGVMDRQLSGAGGSEDKAPEFDDKNYDVDASQKRSRGMPMGQGLNKLSRSKLIRDKVSSLGLTSDQKAQIVNFARKAEEDTKHATDAVPASKDNPMATLESKVKMAAIKRSEFDKLLLDLLVRFGKSTEEAESMVVNFKDDTMEDVIKAITQVDIVASPKPLRTKPLPSPVATTGQSGRASLASRLKAIKDTKTGPVTSPQPLEDKDPKVDWFMFSSLPVNERIEYLKNKIRNT